MQYLASRGSCFHGNGPVFWLVHWWNILHAVSTSGECTIAQGRVFVILFLQFELISRSASEMVHLRIPLVQICISMHTMDLLWEKFQWILPLYMKPISFQPKASVVWSVTAAIFIDFCLMILNVFSQHIGQNKWISEFRRTKSQELKCWSTFCVNYFLRYYLMMQHQPIVKRVNGTHEWAHRPFQLLSAPYHCCLYKHRRQDERQPPQSSWLVPICTLT